MEATPTLLIQLPIPQLDFAKQTGNIPLGAACLKMAADNVGAGPVALLPQGIATYLGDAALLDFILAQRPDIVGFGVYTWNLDRSLYMAHQLKKSYHPRIVFGGPEVTPDNQRIRSTDVDYYIYGEGEVLFANLLINGNRWCQKCGHASADKAFEHGQSPYPLGLLEPEIENMVLIETQRGCPHHCGYCFYGKSRRRISTVPPDVVVDMVAWAIDHHIAEAYLLDPCLNARKDLDDLLKAITRINGARQIRLISEIRAETVTDKIADAYADAGFTWFEIGLQSTNPAALKQMNRPTDLKAFLQGVQRLKKRGIKTGIDLIAGLPGDDPEGFSRSVAFVVDNGLIDDVQVFPLSVLPGTPFRKNHQAMQLIFDPTPPYTISKTPTFSDQQILEALDEAQDRFDLCLYPFPDLDLSGCLTQVIQGADNRVCTANIKGVRVITKLIVNRGETAIRLGMLSGQLAHPYQLVFGPRVVDQSIVFEMIRGFSKANPFTPFEVVLVEPAKMPDMQKLLDACQLHRPHYLDNDLRFLYPTPGNRAMLVTLLSQKRRIVFGGAMQRQVHWWTADSLPAARELEALQMLDGVFIPDRYTSFDLDQWQTRWAPESEDLPLITFADPAAQKHWITLTTADDYWLALLPGDGPDGTPSLY